MENIIRILVINPWGINGDDQYANGFCSGMSKIADVDLVTNYYYPHLKSSYNVYNIFFKFSENMNKGLLRRVLRGYEYWATYRRILKLIRKNNYDIIHIQWLLFYSLDIKLLDKIKKHCKKLVLTAHNAIPHVNGESKVNILQKLYDKFDAIVIHGNFIWEELKSTLNWMIEKYLSKNMVENMKMLRKLIHQTYMELDFNLRKDL